jgi:uncharacterized protein YlzI (FlbEa/FlbD family)
MRMIELTEVGEGQKLAVNAALITHIKAATGYPGVSGTLVFFNPNGQALHVRESMEDVLELC